MSTKAGMGPTATVQKGAAMAPARPPMELGIYRGAIKGGESLKGPIPAPKSQISPTPFAGNKGLLGAPHQPMPGGTIRSIGGMAGGDSLMTASPSSFFPGINVPR